MFDHYQTRTIYSIEKFHADSITDSKQAFIHPLQHTYQMPGSLESKSTFIASYRLFSGYAHPRGELLDISHDPVRLTVWVIHSSFG